MASGGAGSGFWQSACSYRAAGNILLALASSGFYSLRLASLLHYLT